ncbi:N-acetylmuramoyl-L-alanine amidase [Poriferisphaera corsica]|uniref:N-acetylmuramoyl-L-alanine amidase n=1 Tax=Poriferisphaera corsica TaxID=2528020 RepID=A0A517YWB3_9BACT|nr:peptidoglycan recognition family protein [Poriferisphaera corsica]QDU34513.1 N-acetylmuramoyl-L-alanine amidase [Poriferisphaera corsica]
MKLSRRNILMIGISMLAAGCVDTRMRYLPRPRVDWPHASKPNSSNRLSIAPKPAQKTAAARPATYSRTRSTPSNSTTRRSVTSQQTKVSHGAFRPIARSNWTKIGPAKGRVNTMRGVNKITIHHEGSSTFWTTDYRTTAKHLDDVRKGHVGNKGWGDIGYHYIIDRAGRVWEGRSIRYQGAHVSGHNPNNVGVMVLGNFEKQKPTKAQLTALQTTLRALIRKYRVPVTRVYTHQELMPTKCPGRNLQPLTVKIRKSGVLT